MLSNKFVLYVGTAVLNAVIGLIASVLLANFISPNEFGRIGVFMSLIYLAVPLVSLSIDGLVAVNKTTLSEYEYESFRETSVTLASFMFLVTQVVLTGFWLSHHFEDELFLLIPVFAFTRFMFVLIGIECISEGRARTYLKLSTFNSLLTLILSYIFLGYWFTANARIVGIILSELVLVAIVFKTKLKPLFSMKYEKKFVKQIFANAWPCTIGLFGGWCLNESDKIIVLHISGLEMAGIYTAGATLASVMMTVNQSVTNALIPSLFKDLSFGQQSIRQLIFRYCLKFGLANSIFACAAILGFYVLGDYILPDKYRLASTYFYGLAFASIAISLFRPLSLISEFFKCAKLRAIAIVTGGAVTVMVAVLGIQVFSNMLWAPIGISTGYSTALLIIYFALVKEKH